MTKKLITTTIGDGFSSNPDDITTIRTALDGLGYTDPNPDFGYIDSNLDKNIRSFQNDNDLKVDGIITPGGETEAAIADATDDNNNDGSFEEAGAKSPQTQCINCDDWHGGVYSPRICYDCWKNMGLPNPYEGEDEPNAEEIKSEDAG